MPAHLIEEWIIYVRISDDREALALGVKRQEKLCRELHRTARLPGRILTVCCDNDLTAYDESSRYKPREGYFHMVALLRERPGRRGVLAYHTDRLHKNHRELEDFIDVAEECNVPVRTVQAGIVDLSTPIGRAHARNGCTMARYESEQKAVRHRDKVRELVEAGLIGNGGPRPFGYERVYEGEGARRRIVRDELHPEEAPIVKECVQRVLDGNTIMSVVKWLNEEGWTTTLGNRWTDQALRSMLRSGRIAGLREHKRKIVGKAVWPAIIDEESHRQLRAMFMPKSTRESRGPTIHRYWLSGMVYCGACESCNSGRGVRMRNSTQAGIPRYLCPTTGEGCGKRSIEIRHLEPMIEALVLRKLSGPDVLARIAARRNDNAGKAASLTTQIDADERRLKLLQAELDEAPDDDLPEVVTSIRRVRTRLKENREELAATTAEPGVRLLGEDLPERWAGLDVPEKRQLALLVVKRIVIGPGTPGKFNPGRVTIEPA